MDITECEAERDYLKKAIERYVELDKDLTANDMDWEDACAELYRIAGHTYNRYTT